MKYLNEVKASLHLELMLNFTGLGKNAEISVLRFVLLILLCY